MPRRKAEVEEAKRILERLVGAEKAEEVATFLANYIELTGKDINEALRELFDTAMTAKAFAKLTAPDLVACAHFLKLLDVLFFRHVYAITPVEAVVQQADKYSEATKKILESYASGLAPLVEPIIERKITEKVEKLAPPKREEEKGVKEKKSENTLLGKAVDTIMTAISEEIASRVSADVAETVAPALRDRIIDMLRKGEIRIVLPGEELLGGGESTGEE